MPELQLPDDAIDARHTPVFDPDTLPAGLARVHRATVWATLHVLEGSVRFTDLEGDDRRDARVEAGDQLHIAPAIAHHIDPSTDARFFVQIHRLPDDPLIPRDDEQVDAVRRSGPWQHRGRDLDTTDEVTELAVRQYVDICQDPILEPYFDFGPGFTDWDAHVRAAADYWSRTLFESPNRDADAVLERFRRRHERVPFTVEAFDRWLDIFHTTVDQGWAGPNAEHLKKRATGLAWAAASRTLGKGVWHPAAPQ
jgi:hemoglobin